MTAAPSLTLNPLSPSSYYYLLKVVTDINLHVKKEETETEEKEKEKEKKRHVLGRS